MYVCIAPKQAINEADEAVTGLTARQKTPIGALSTDRAELKPNISATSKGRQHHHHHHQQQQQQYQHKQPKHIAQSMERKH